MVGIAGSPGAGKSTVAKEVAVRLNALWLQKQGEKNGDTGASPTEIAVAVPMDGFHLYRWQLDAMEVNPPCFLNLQFLNLMSVLLRVAAMLVALFEELHNALSSCFSYKSWLPGQLLFLLITLL